MTQNGWLDTRYLCDRYKRCLACIATKPHEILTQELSQPTSPVINMFEPWKLICFRIYLNKTVTWIIQWGAFHMTQFWHITLPLQERTRAALLESLHQDLYQKNLEFFGHVPVSETSKQPSDGNNGLFNTFRKAISGKVGRALSILALFHCKMILMIWKGGAHTRSKHDVCCYRGPSQVTCVCDVTVLCLFSLLVITRCKKWLSNSFS